MLIPFPQVDNSLSFWLPSDNPNGDPSVVFELSVNFAHKRFAFL